MRKTLVDHAALIKSSKDDALDMMAEKYGIERRDIKLDSLSSIYEKTLRSAEIIIESCLKKGMPTNEAVSQVTYSNIAAIMTEWKNPLKDVRNVGAAISKYYHRVGNVDESNIVLVRERALAKIKGEEVILNHEKYSKNGGNIEFSKADKRNGLKLPPRIGVNQMFLFGVYRSDGIINRKGTNEFKLSGKTGDEAFYTATLENMIEESFNLKVKTYMQPKKGTNAGNDVSIHITSKGHLEYLNHTVGLIDHDRRFAPLNAEGIGQKKDEIPNYYLSYLMGIIAGGGHIGLEAGIPQLKFKDKRQDYIPEMIRILNIIDTELKPYQSPNNPGYLHFGKKMVRKMIDYSVPFVISPTQKGLFVNPRQTKEIEKYFSIK